MVEKIYSGIREKIEQASLLNIMTSSNLFGRGIGERKIRPILETYPDILTNTAKQTTETLVKIPGIGKENAKSFLENIPRFLEFLKECGLESKLSGTSIPKKMAEEKAVSVVDKTHPLYQKHIIMTKLRDPIILEGLKRMGAILDDKIGKNTFVVITKSHDDESNKTKYAKEHGIPVMIPSEFMETYFS